VSSPPRHRILLASQPVDAGVPQHVLDLVASLDPERFAIDVACPPESTLWAGLGSMAWVSRHPIGGAREPSAGDAVTLGRLLRLAGSADLVHGHSSKAGFLARLASRLRRRSGACLFTPHGWSFWSAEGGKARAYLALERAAARWCRVILSVSAHERDAGLAAGVGRAEQYRVIPNGVDLDRFAAEPHPVAGRVVMVARLAAPKRADLAVRALARVRARVPSATLRLIGDGPDRPGVERLAAELGVGEAVEVLGTRSDVPALLAEASCLLLASDYEGCPLTVLEAMAAGVPVVATRVGGVPELVDEGETGLLAPAGDADGIAAALEQVLSDAVLARRLGSAGRERARREYSRARMAAETVAVYDELLRGRPNAPQA
jgi:glycosyltransferase involved in cell wall biosynthesis